MALPPKPKLIHAEKGMSIAAAAELIRYRWQEYKAAPKRPESNEDDDESGYTLDLTTYRDEALNQLKRDIRDCGWCIHHAKGFKGLQQLYDDATKSVPERESYELEALIDWGFLFIGEWLV